MHLVSFGKRGEERPGVLRDDGRIVPLAQVDATLPSSLRGLITDGHLAAGRARLDERLAAYRGATVECAAVRLGPPLIDPGKIICIGLNYQDHATEQGKPWPPQPLLFAKGINALVGPEDDIVLPDEDGAVDYEVELVVVIGRRARRVAREQAWSVVAGLMVGNDVSARRWQNSDGQWFRAKSADTFFPCGPALVSADAVVDVPGMRLTTRVNGDLRQDATAAQMIHDVSAVIAYISRFMTLEPGDLISTGTPAGVGCFRKPPVFLQAGDVVECSIVGLGTLRNRVVAALA